MLFLKQSTAAQSVLIGPFIDDTDGATPETGLTIANTDIRLSKAGGNLAAKNSGGGTSDEAGWYTITLDATDTNTVGALQVHVKVSGALMVHHEFHVLEENVYDALIGASAGLGTDVAAILLDTAEIGTAGAGLTDITINAASVDLVWDEILTGGTHNIATSAGRRLRGIQEFQGYESGAVWIDTANGTAGTTDYENGTVELPVLTLADALTIASSLNLKNFVATRDSTIAPAADFNDFSIYGTGYTFTLGGHDYAGTHIFHASPVTGTATSSNNTDHFDVLDSIIGDITVDDAHLTRCGLTGTITLSGVGSGTPGELKMINCFSLVAGASTPILDFGTGTENHNVSIANYQNGIEIRNFNVTTTGGTDLFSMSGTGQIVIASSCDGGTINLRGQWKVTDNSGGAVTITQDDVATELSAILVDTGTTLQAELDAIQAAVITNAAGTDIAADIIAVKAETAAILLDTAEIGTAGAGLTDLGGMSTGMKAEVNTEADTALTDYDPPTNTEMEARTLAAASYFDPAADTVATVTSVTNQHTLAEIADGVLDEAMVETTGAPAVTGTFRAALQWMFGLSRNKITQTATTTTLRNDADSADLATSTVSDDSTTYTRGEWSA